MTPLFDYLWPCLVLGVLVGVGAGFPIWRRRFAGRPSALAFLASGIGALAAMLLWSGPLGGADRFIGAVEPPIRQMLVEYEMTQVSAELRRAPLRRQIVYTGPADELQRSELVRMAEEAPGVSSATWNLRVGELPILVEAGAAALFGLLIGLLIAYLLEVRRRNNREWSW